MLAVYSFLVRSLPAVIGAAKLVYRFDQRANVIRVRELRYAMAQIEHRSEEHTSELQSH